MLKPKKIPLNIIKVICRVVVIPAAFYIVIGNWVVGGCLMIGAILLERNWYRCPHCGHRLDMKVPLTGTSTCPNCYELLL